MALGQKTKPPSFDHNAKHLECLDVDERPPPRMKLADAQHHAQLLATFCFMDKPIIGIYSCIHNETAWHVGEAR